LELKIRLLKYQLITDLCKCLVEGVVLNRQWVLGKEPSIVYVISSSRVELTLVRGGAKQSYGKDVCTQ
jgi:hypothetical protein